MLEINAAIGNIFQDKEFVEAKSRNFERLHLSRTELEKRILRKTGNRGTDVGIKLDSGIRLCHGDVIGKGDVKIVIKQMPEKVLLVTLKTQDMIDVAILLGHIIGNRHRPISIQEGKIISFPIQAYSEKDVFTKLFQSIIDHIEIKVEEQIFSPHSGADVHEH